MSTPELTDEEAAKKEPDMKRLTLIEWCIALACAVVLLQVVGCLLLWAP